MRAGPVSADGSLSEAAIILLHAVSGVDMGLLRSARVRASRSNWLHAPWYPYQPGGAITVGRTIWCTRIWSDPHKHGDGSMGACWQWLVLLSHEVGHLPQAERFGRSLLAKARYLAAFTWQYGIRAVLLKKHVHDGSPLELEADRGRHILLRLIGDAAARHPVVAAVHAGDTVAVRLWCGGQTERIAALGAAYAERNFV